MTLIEWLEKEALRNFDNAGKATTSRRKSNLRHRAKRLREAADEIERLEARVAELKAALRQIANQRRSIEMDTEEKEIADFEQGFDMCVLTAREFVAPDWQEPQPFDIGDNNET